MGRIEKINTGYIWTIDNKEEEEAGIYRDLLAQLEQQPGWTGHVGPGLGPGSGPGSGPGQVTVKSSAMVRLPEFLNQKVFEYEDAEQLILQIGRQLMVLKAAKKGILFLNLDDIIVIDQQFFFLSRLDHVVQVHMQVQGQEYLTLSYPMKISTADERFLAPEVKEGYKVLPFITPVSSGYYSLAKLCLYCLQLDDSLGIDSIKDSKMYFFFERCLQKAPANRFLIYI
jgi:hypothetical protein